MKINPSFTILLLILFFKISSAEAAVQKFDLSPTQWQQTKPEDLAWLDPIIKDKKFVYLGEAAHWIDEKYDYRLVLIQYLISRGYNVIGMEMGLSDAEKINQYFLSGDANHLEQLGIYGYRDKFIRDRQKQFKCYMGKDAYPDFRKYYSHEEKWFYQQVLSVAQHYKKDIRHFGYDIDTAPGGGYQDMLDSLKDQRFDSLRRTIFDISQLSTVDAEIQGLQQLLADLPGMKSLFGNDEAYESFYLKADLLHESFKMVRAIYSYPCSDASQEEMLKWTQEFVSSLAIREQAMMRRMDWVLKHSKSTDKFILMGHDFHMSKDPAALTFTSVNVPEEYTQKMWPSIGEYVSKKYNTLSIWEVHASGQQSISTCKTLACPVESEAGQLGVLLSQLGKAFILPVESNLTDLPWLTQRKDMATNAGKNGVVAKGNADLIFFIDTVSPLRLR
jgi:hypothetical protein